MKKSTFILFVAVAVAALATSFLIQRRAGATIRQNEDSLRQQQDEIKRATAANQHLSAAIAQTDQTTSTSAGVADYRGELAQLQAQASTLRAQQVQLSNQQWNARLSAGIHLLSAGNSNLFDHNETLGATMAGSPRPESGKLNDGRGFGAALREYAKEHEGQFPSTLDQVTAYLPKPLTADSGSWENAPVSGTNDFEIVYQGGTNDLGNIPPRRVALLRERQPWLTPDGKWGADLRVRRWRG